MSGILAWRCRRGTAAIEFAVIVPLALLLLFGVVEAGRVFWVMNTLQHATEAAGRHVMVNATVTPAEVVAYAQGRLPGLDAAEVTVTATPGTIGSINYLTIQATYSFHYLLSVLPGGPLTLTGSSKVPLLP